MSSSSSRNRRRAATANDAELTIKSGPRNTTVDYLNAFGGIQEEADEIEGRYDDRYRAKSVDFIREKQAKDNKKRSNSIADMVVDDLIKTFMKTGESEIKQPNSRSISRSSVDVLNAFGGIAEEDEDEDS
jgi:hypothetical protein